MTNSSKKHACDNHMRRIPPKIDQNLRHRVPRQPENEYRPVTSTLWYNTRKPMAGSIGSDQFEIGRQFAGRRSNSRTRRIIARFDSRIRTIRGLRIPSWARIKRGETRIRRPTEKKLLPMAFGSSVSMSKTVSGLLGSVGSAAILRCRPVPPWPHRRWAAAWCPACAAVPSLS